MCSLIKPVINRSRHKKVGVGDGKRHANKNPTGKVGLMKIMKKDFTVWKLIFHSVLLRFYR